MKISQKNNCILKNIKRETNKEANNLETSTEFLNGVIYTFSKRWKEKKYFTDIKDDTDDQNNFFVRNNQNTAFFHEDSNPDYCSFKSTNLFGDINFVEKTNLKNKFTDNFDLFNIKYKGIDLIMYN
jgi:hypothetical protein